MFGVKGSENVHNCGVRLWTSSDKWVQLSVNVILSGKTSLMLEVHKAGFRREGHKLRNMRCHLSFR